MTNHLRSLLAASLLTSVLPCATPARAAESAPPKAKADVPKERPITPLNIPDVLRHDLVTLDVPVGIPEQVEIAVPIGGRKEVLRLFRTSLRATGAKLILDRGNGVMEEAPLPPHRTYRGTVASNGALVAASVIDGRLWAMIDMPGDTVFVQPASDFDAARPASAHVVYAHSATAPRDFHRCGNDEAKLASPDWMLGIPNDPGERPGAGDVDPRGMGGGGDGSNGGNEGGNGGGNEGGSEGGIAGTTPFIAEIAFDADFEFFQKNGSSAVNTVNDIENVMNSVSLVYDRDVNISYEYTTFVVRTTSTDPYTTSVMTDLLCEFRNKWNTTPEVEIQRDVAQLFTGKTISGSVIGLAWLGVVCNQSGSACTGAGNLAYSAVESRFTTTFDFRISLSAHEIGHNWQAQHCDSTNPCNIMCSIINSCQGTTGTNLKFSASEQAQITSYRNAVACDPALPAPITLPFSDNFDATTTINTTNWIHSKGAALTTAALGEPSPTRSLNLDAISNLEYGDDEIRSNFMLLAGLPTAFLTYSTEHRGVESGKQLIVEYLNSSLDWVAINTITSDGVDQSTFTSWQHTLPAAAKHNKFRIRFRAAVDAQDDDWYIDSVGVSAVILPPNDECSGSTLISEGAIPFDSTSATASATALPVTCDDGTGTVMQKDLWYILTASCTGNMTVSTCGNANFNTRLAAYSLACPPFGSLIACNNDGAGCAGFTSSMTFPVVAGNSIIVRLGGVTGGGTGTLNITCTPVAPCPADFDDDGIVGASDLSEVLNAWGGPLGDLNGDGTTDAADLAELLGAWGNC
ncbi:MAG: M12 family metallo-peptidase [bacterium]